ncbi:hypothetical protein D3C87_1406120 [compost metagenome]
MDGRVLEGPRPLRGVIDHRIRIAIDGRILGDIILRRVNVAAADAEHSGCAPLVLVDPNAEDAVGGKPDVRRDVFAGVNADLAVGALVDDHFGRLVHDASDLDRIVTRSEPEAAVIALFRAASSVGDVLVADVRRVHPVGKIHVAVGHLAADGVA